jgi:hypothetical protein
MQTCKFLIILHADAKSWEDAGPLNVKYLVNGKNFKRNLKIKPRIILKNLDRRPILKARAFK